FNQFSVGIEIDNAGPLTRTGDGKFVSWFGGVYPASDAVGGIHRNETTPRFWLQYTEVQLALVEQICALLVATYPIKLMVGHEEIAPGRKIDPGPAFPLDRLRGRLLTDLRSD